jgi:hypothetical protein
MTTTVSASDEPALVLVSENGAPGDDGDPGQNGTGLNNIRYSLLNNPLMSIFKTNKLTDTIAPNNQDVDITISRASIATYVNRYGIVQTAAIDEAREEKEGFLIEGSSTNYCLYSKDFTNAAWLQTIYGGTSWNKTDNSLDITDIYGTNLATKIVSAGTPNDIMCRIFAPMPPAGQVSNSIWIYIPSGQGVSNCEFSTDYNDADLFDIEIIDSFDQWVRVSSQGTTIGSRTFCDFSIKPDGVTPTLGFTCYIMEAQCEPEITTSLIPTTTAAVTRARDEFFCDAFNNISQGIRTVCFTYNQNQINESKSKTFIAYESVFGPNKATIYQAINSKRIAIYDGSTSSFATSPLEDGENFVVIVYKSNGTVDSYVNGDLDTQGVPVTASPFATGATLELGSTNNFTGSLDSNIRDLRVYEQELNADEIKYLSGV